MADDTQNILCGTCRIPVEGPADPDSQDVFSCPRCGNSDTLENVMASAKSFVEELAARSLQESAREAARGSKFIKFEGKSIPHRTYRFITNHKF
ncbi:MAG: hypothetical protein IBX58_08170 [Roseovarius sp.]|nr:hypothetical protein [Roseovarius sp.]